MRYVFSYKSAFFISFIYFIFGIIWIYFSDNAAQIISSSSNQATLLQTYKGIFYVFITSILLYFLSLRFLKLQHSNDTKQLKILEKQGELAKSLEKSGHLYRDLFDNMLDSVSHCKMIYENGTPVDFKFLKVNPSFKSMTGFENATGHKMSDLIPNYAEENFETILKFHEVASGGKPCRYEHYLRALDKWFSFSLFSPTKGEIIAIAADVTETKKYQQYILGAKERFDMLAHHDPLTQLPNRLSLVELLNLKTDNMEDHPFALFFIDLDGFKEINDSYGHRFGDNLLIHVTKLLEETFIEDSFIARTGGDEFVIILNCQKDKTLIYKKMEHLVEILNHPIQIDNIDVYITASVGIAMYPQDAKTPEELLQHADAAMYNAKKMGKNTYSFYSTDLTTSALHRTTVATNLKKALQNNELELYFQPQVDAQSHTIIGAEALLRWFSPEGTIPPSIFIPIAEETGLILDVGQWVLEQSFIHAKHWKEAYDFKGRIAVNVSAHQLIHPKFLMIVKELLEKTGCNPTWIEIEITESSILENPQRTIHLLEMLKADGFHISIDDFGTGYSSLSYLKNLPIDKLKIDISFVRNITMEPKNQTIVKTIIALAKGLGIATIAEGVESIEELEFLRENNIDSIQGYYFYKPMNLESIELSLQKGI